MKLVKISSVILSFVADKELWGGTEEKKQGVLGKGGGWDKEDEFTKFCLQLLSGKGSENNKVNRRRQRDLIEFIEYLLPLFS